MIIPTTTNIIVTANGLLSDKATCNAIFALSEFFNSLALTMAKRATIMKSKPYKNDGKNEFGFMPTNVVKYGIKDKKNNATPIVQMTL